MSCPARVSGAAVGTLSSLATPQRHCRHAGSARIVRIRVSQLPALATRPNVWMLTPPSARAAAYQLPQATISTAKTGPGALVPSPSRPCCAPPHMSRSPVSVRMPVRSPQAAICRIGARQTVPDANCWAARPELTEPHTKRAPPCQRRRRAASQCGYSLTAPATRRTPLTLRHRAARAEEPAGLLFNGANQHLSGPAPCRVEQ